MEKKLYTLFHDCQRNACSGHLIFQNEAKNIPRQAFVMMNICCKFEKSTYYNLGFRGVIGKISTQW